MCINIKKQASKMNVIFDFLQKIQIISISLKISLKTTFS